MRAFYRMIYKNSKLFFEERSRVEVSRRRFSIFHRVLCKLTSQNSKAGNSNQVLIWIFRLFIKILMMCAPYRMIYKNPKLFFEERSREEVSRRRFSIFHRVLCKLTSLNSKAGNSNQVLIWISCLFKKILMMCAPYRMIYKNPKLFF